MTEEWLPFVVFALAVLVAMLFVEVSRLSKELRHAMTIVDIYRCALHDFDGTMVNPDRIRRAASDRARSHLEQEGAPWS